MNFFIIAQHHKEEIQDKNTLIAANIEFTILDPLEHRYLPQSDILEYEISSYKEKTGGIVTNCTLILDNTKYTYTPDLHPELIIGLSVCIYFQINNKIRVPRFHLFVDDNGFQCISDGNERTCKLHLVDYSYYLKKTKETNDWTDSLIIVDTTVSSHLTSTKPLVDLLLARAGFKIYQPDDPLDFTLPYVEITNDIWTELSLLATAYRVHLECSYINGIRFEGSKYSDFFNEIENDIGITLTDDNVIFCRRYDDIQNYKNTIRLKWTHFKKINDSTFWKYSDLPVSYDDNFVMKYPFVGNSREIEINENYEAPYTYVDNTGQVHKVVYAEEVFTKEEFSNNLSSDNGNIEVVKFDTTSFKDRAVIQLKTNQPDLLNSATIQGSGIYQELNFSYFIKNEDEVLREGTHSISINNKYLSDDYYEGVPFYQRWAQDELAERIKKKRKYFIKTNLVIFTANVDAFVALNLIKGCGAVEDKAIITKFTLKYKKSAAFETSLWVTSE